MDSSITRSSQPAEPVYQLQPPRPTCGVRRTRRRPPRTVPAGSAPPLRGSGATDRTQHLQQLTARSRRPSSASARYHPQRRVGVLAAVLPHPGDIALDITGIMRGVFERRRQQADQALLFRRSGWRSTASNAVSARAGGAAWEITAQACASASIRHSSLAEEPAPRHRRTRRGGTIPHPNHPD